MFFIPKGINLKGEFELAYYSTAVQHISHYATRIPGIIIRISRAFYLFLFIFRRAWSTEDGTLYNENGHY